MRPAATLPKSRRRWRPFARPACRGCRTAGVPPEACTSISISLSLSSPARGLRRKALDSSRSSSHADQRIEDASARSGRVPARPCVFVHTSGRWRSRQGRARLLSTSRPDIADLGELRRLHLEEWAPASLARRRDISVLPTPVGPIMMLLLRAALRRAWRGSTAAAPAVAECDGDCALGVRLANKMKQDEFGDDFAGRKMAHSSRTRRAQPSASTKHLCWNPVSVGRTTTCTDQESVSVRGAPQEPVNNKRIDAEPVAASTVLFADKIHRCHACARLLAEPVVRATRSGAVHAAE